jgi:hypothetical protein
MRTRKEKADEAPMPRKKRAPAMSLEARENQLISMAYDYAEKQFAAGTASSQITTEFLKRGSTRERLEKEILERNKELLTAKTEDLKTRQNSEALYEQAIEAMRRYSGNVGGEPL